MKKFYIILLFIFANDFLLAKNFEIEVNTGVESIIGIDGLETPINLAPSIFNNFKVKKAKDYTNIKKIDNNNGNGNTNNNNNNSSNDIFFIPEETQTKKIALLVSNYLYESIQNNYYTSLSLKDNNLGLGFNLKTNGKKIFGQDYKDITFGFKIDNNYINADIKYILNKDYKKYYGIDKIYDKKEYNDKSFLYNFNVSPIKYKNISANIKVTGINKNAEINPYLSYNKSNFYFNIGPNFYTSKDILNVNDEISMIYNAAPGYNKIEYFKDWTLKNNVPDLSNDTNFYNDKPDFLKAEVSGYKGTHRLLGTPSGSLFGESLIKFITKETINELKNDKNFKETFNLIDNIKNDRIFSIGISSITLKPKLESEFGNQKAVNSIISRLSQTLLKKLNIETEDKSETHILNILPNNIKEILPYINPEYNIFTDTNKYNLNYLYYGFNGPARDKIINKPNNTSNTNNNIIISNNTNRVIIEKERDFTEDLNTYIIPNFHNEYPLINSIQTGKGLLEQIVKIIFSSSEKTKYFNMIKNPDEIVGAELFRSLYFHNSEKDINKQILKNEINEWKKELNNISDKKQKNSTSLLINTGYIGENLKINASLNLFNNSSLNAQNFIFNKINNNILLNFSYINKGFKLNSSLNSDFSKYYLKTNNLEANYSNYNFTTKNYIAYTFKPNKKYAIELGINHLGTASYIKVDNLLKDGKVFSMEIVKRDEKGNPIGLNGESLEINKITEKELINKAIEKGKGKLPIDTKQSDYLQKEAKKLNSGWYNIYNIIAPKLGITYYATDNLEISNNIQIPIAIKNKSFSGINFVYNANIRYVLTDEYINIFKDFKNKYNIGTNGNIYLAYSTIDGIKTKINTNIKIPFINIHFNSKTIKNFNIKANSNISNLPIKPLIIFENNNNEKSLKYGFEIQTGNIKTSFGVGKSNEKEDETYKEIHKLLSLDKTKDIEIFENKKYLFDNIITNSKISFAKLEYSKNNYIFNAGINVKNLNDEYTLENSDKSENELDFKFTDKDISDLGNYNNKSSYIIYASKNIGGSWVYFVPLKLEDKIVEYKNTTNINKKNIEANLSLSKTNKTGFNFNTNLDFKYSFININNKEETKTTTYSKTNVYAIDIAKNQKYIDIKERFNDSNKVNIEKDIPNNNYYNHINALITKNGGEYNFPWYYASYNFTDSNRNSVINAAKAGLEIKKESEKIYSENNINMIDIEAKLDTTLGYNYKLNSKSIIGINLVHLLDFKYMKLNRLKFNDTNIYGRDKLQIKNFITPEIKLEYEINKKISINMLNGITFKFNNKKYDGMKYKFESGIKYEW